MDTYRTTISIIVVNLIFLCFSAQAWASHRFEKSQKYSENIINRTLLSSLDFHSTDYLWLENQQLNVQAVDALEFIARSSHHGLNPNDYHFDLLQHVDPAISETDAQQFDVLLTDGLLKLIHDISVGRLDPTVVDPKWSIPRLSFDAAKFLQFALQGDYFKACLDALIPTSNQYCQIKAAARRFQAYVDHGGWPVIPKLPVLRAGDVHQNISMIRERLAFEDNTLVLMVPGQSSHYDENLEQAVKRFQRRYSLKVDGVIGPATHHAMNVSATERLQQIKINLERIRWLPGYLVILANVMSWLIWQIIG